MEQLSRPYVRSRAHMARARRSIVRGVGSAYRAGRRAETLVFAHAEGAELRDVDGNTYVDHVLGFGPMLLGHRLPAVMRAVEAAATHSVLHGGQHAGEAELAERVVALVPGAELVAFSNSGSEAAHLAVRLARAATGRDLVLKFQGHYHGWMDPLHCNGILQQPERADVGFAVRHNVPGLPAPPGVLVTEWNDLAALDAVLDRVGDRVAAVIMEPVPCNFGTFEPAPGYLERVRHRCNRAGALLAFDEVITGFRLGLGGAQERYGVTPDLTVLAKAIGSGFPISAVAGRADVMRVAADGPVAHIGTYNSNLLSVTAASVTLAQLADGGPSLYARLQERSAQLAEGLAGLAAAADAPLVVNQIGPVLQLFWSPEGPVRSPEASRAADPEPVGLFAAALRDRGVYALERGMWFVSTAHTEEHIARTLEAAEGALPVVLTGLLQRTRDG